MGDADSLITTVFDGGFDPVPVVAETGDSIEVVVLDAGGSTVLTVRAEAGARRPPVVVRTDPPRDKTDVPVNASIVIVFSEPVDAATLTASSVRLLLGATPVSGTVNLLQGTATAAVFTPSAQLTANDRYRLVVTEAVRDLQGDALEAGASVEFTTGTIVLGTLESVAVVPGDSGVEVLVGSQFQMTAIPRDAQGNVLAGRPTGWSSRNPAVAAVSSTGLVTALTEGLAAIVADVEGVVGIGFVRVSSGLAPVGSVIVRPDSTRLSIGEKLLLVLEIRDPDGKILESPRPSTWTSSSPEVATVTPLTSRSAEVTGVGLGIAKITATVEGKSDTAVVAVGAAGEIDGLVVSPESLTVVLQAVRQLSVAARDDQGFLNPVPAEQVTWVSSDSLVASVTSSGLVTGQQGGSATITGTWNGHQATATATVVELSFTAISAGGLHTCGVTPSGAAFCWGANGSGQLGTGRTEGELMPAAVAGGHAFATVSVTWNSTCGLATDGTAYCWGMDSYGGTEPCVSSNTLCNYTPTAVPGGLKFIDVSAGGSGTACGVSTDSVAYCWGWGSATLQKVELDLKVTAISTSWSHTCALTVGGSAYCWGANRDGQLGTGDTIYSASPRPVAGALTFVAIGVGETHTSGLTSEGAAYTWGKSPSWSTTGSLSPRRVMTGVTLSALSAGTHNTGGLDSSGTAHFWNDATSWTVPGGFSFAQLDLGDDHHCAVTTGGVGYCWDRTGPPLKVGGQP